MLQEKIWLKWNLNTIVWGNNPYMWSEVYIVQKVVEAVSGGGGGFGGRPGKMWSDIKKQIKKKGLNDEDVEKFLKVVVRVNDLTFDEYSTYTNIEACYGYVLVNSNTSTQIPVQLVSRNIHNYASSTNPCNDAAYFTGLSGAMDKDTSFLFPGFTNLIAPFQPAIN